MKDPERWDRTSPHKIDRKWAFYLGWTSEKEFWWQRLMFRHPVRQIIIIECKIQSEIYIVIWLYLTWVIDSWAVMLLVVWQFSAMLLAVETNPSVYQVVPTLGGSVVILMPTCRMEIGNSGCGLLLSQSLKSGWGSSTCSCSTSLSSCGIQLSDKWQLAKNTQLPWKQAIINSQADWFISVT